MEKFFTTQMPQVASEAGGNSQTPALQASPVKDFKARKYCFTLFDITPEKLDNLSSYFLGLKRLKVIMGVETCPTTGKKHIQGYLESDSQIRGNTLNKVWAGRWTKALGNRLANVKYCSKEGDVIWDDFKIKIAKPVKLIDPIKDWQIKILKELEEEPDDRTINWYWSKEGKVGKTQFVKYVAKKYEGRCRFSTTNKSSDIVTIADECIDIYLFNFTRTTEGFCPFMALESLKDGLVSEGKLKKEMRQIVMNSPHIYVFANYPPERNKMSKDRWNINEIS